MMIPYPSPRKSSGGGNSGPVRVRKRYFPIGTGGATFVAHTESAVTSKAALIAEIQAIDPTIPATAIGQEFLAIGGGGNGGVGVGATGGLGGGTKFVEIMLSEVSDGDIAIEIGAGASAGSPAPGAGAATSVIDGSTEICAASGGFGGVAEGQTPTADEVYSLAVSNNADYPNPMSTGSFFGGPASASGSGCGGRLPTSTEMWPDPMGMGVFYQSGGTACNAEPWRVYGGFGSGAAGSPCDDTVFRSCGGGGASNSSGDGGDGGDGGGGGGAGGDGFLGGAGGNGRLRRRPFAWESVA
ncbi:hypothetical protein [Rhizobium laguerreae]|uniref:hypothetical protein n=1 Tax=Rhizobium laguerreae TaxID=1076926 RepID=UPI001C904E09|nr:hypothetical protein [Rhizobium laguerreae]MBY3363753.1 hypothetical protein [Rhizobium laguerreae]